MLPVDRYLKKLHIGFSINICAILFNTKTLGPSGPPRVSQQISCIDRCAIQMPLKYAAILVTAVIRSSLSTLYVQRDGGNDGLLQIIFSFCSDGHGIFRPSGNICGDQNSKIMVSNRELVGVAYSTAMTGTPAASAAFIATPVLATANHIDLNFRARWS